jgi:hypothetical protein
MHIPTEVKMTEVETIALPLLPATTNDETEVGIASTLSCRVIDNKVLSTMLVENPATSSIKQYIRQQMEQVIIWVIGTLSLNDMLTSPEIITREVVKMLEQFFAEINITLISFSLDEIKYPDELTEAVFDMMGRWKLLDAMINLMPTDPGTKDLTQLRVKIFSLSSDGRISEPRHGTFKVSTASLFRRQKLRKQMQPNSTKVRLLRPQKPVSGSIQNQILFSKNAV